MLTTDAKQQVTERVAAFEAATGVQLVTALQPRCDDYPEIPWKAFAAGAALGSLLALLSQVLRATGQPHHWNEPGSVMILALVLGPGLVMAALALLVPPVARLFLSAARADGEVRQAAQALFLEHELFGTDSRTGILLLIAAFERRVVLLADRGLRAKLPRAARDDIVAAMTAALQSANGAAAFVAGIDRLEAIVREHGISARGDRNTLPDHLDSHRGEGDSC